MAEAPNPNWPSVESIREFSTNSEVIQEYLALMKVGYEKGESAESIMAHILASALFRFHKMPLRRN